MRNFALYLLTVIFIYPAIAQQRTANWFFGNKAGLSFSNGVPQFQSGSLATIEGCASISDQSGRLLFYTDGRTVWNKHHLEMDNGTGLLGGVKGSSTQAALIIPYPKNDSLYYVFTVDEFDVLNPSNYGLRYSIVNMKRNSGLGAVIQKNIRIIGTDYFLSEKLAAVMHSNGRDIWLLTHNPYTNNFEEYLITNAGINVTPAVMPAYSGLAGSMVRGYLKFSPDGKRVAAAYNERQVIVYDFNTLTGAITGPKKIPNAIGSCGAYGIEFSCNSKLLYVSEVDACRSDGPYGYDLYQYNISLLTEAEIINSRFRLASSRVVGTSIGALQMGMDGKIYIANYSKPYLGAIINPNVVGAGCGYVEQHFNLPDTVTCAFGLPNFVQTLNISDSFKVNKNCGSLNVQFEVNQIVDSVHWNFGDPRSSLNESFAINPSHLFTEDGFYTVQAILYKKCSVDTAWRKIAVGRSHSLLGQDLSLCYGDTAVLRISVENATYNWSDGSNADSFVVTNSEPVWVDISLGGCTLRDSITIRYKPNPAVMIGPDTAVCMNEFPFTVGQSMPNAQYSWSTGETNPFISIPRTGVYWLEIIVDGCSARDTLLVSGKPTTSVTIGNDTSFCEGGFVLLESAPQSLSYLWSTGSTESTLQVGAPGLYWCRGTNEYGCKTWDSVIVLQKPLPIFTLGNDTIICERTSYKLDIGAAGDQFLWQDGTVSSHYYISEPGMYSVIVTKNGCSKGDSFVVRMQLLPRPNLGADTTICLGSSFLLLPRDGDNFIWHDGSTAGTYKVSGPGQYQVTAYNRCGSSSDFIAIKQIVCSLAFPTAFTPNGDGRNDLFQAGNAFNVQAFHLQVFNRWGNKVFETDDPKRGWDGLLNGVPQKSDVFVWLVSYRDMFGKSYHQKGTVVLVR